MTVLTWKYISLKQLDDFYAYPTANERLQAIRGIFDLKEGDEHASIVADMYYYALIFAQESGFNPEQASALISILREVHTATVSAPYLCLDRDFSYFKELLLRHSVQRPPFSQKIYSLRDMEAVMAYVRDTYFRHYAMYKYAFTKKLKLNLLLKGVEMVVAVPAEATTPALLLPDGAAAIQVEDGGIAATNMGRGDEGEEKSVKLTSIAELKGAEEAEESGPKPLPTPGEQAVEDLRKLIMNVMTSQVDELKASLMSNLSEQDRAINLGIKKMESGGDAEVPSKVQDKKVVPGKK